MTRSSRRCAGPLLRSCRRCSFIATQNRRFCEVIASLPKPAKWEELKIKGHNHISTPLGLSAGGIEEAWGLQVRDWLLARSAGNKL